MENEILGEYASEQISRGGSLNLYDREEDAVYLLAKEKFMERLKKYLQNPHSYDITEGTREGLKIDTCNADAVVCDAIIQYEVFEEIVYG